ncbi:oligosaccharyl transferase subunit ost3/OST6 [Hypoxylon texense]
MGREVQVNMDVDKRKDLIHELELKHQIDSSGTEILIKDEDVRRLRLRILMLRDENTSLRDQIAHNNDTNTKLTAQCDGLSTQIEAKMEVIRSQEQQLRKQEREYSNLKAELQAMNNATQDSANLLAEKLSLSRELAVLKPEIEHLRSQVNHQQATLGEKLALERQVNTLEVELANEKKATKRAMQKRESNDRVEDDLRRKLRETEKKLAAEKAERERLEDQLEQEKRTHRFALQEQDGTREVEADLRKRLQEAQRQLRQEKEDKDKFEEELEAARLATKKMQKNQSSSSNAEEELRTQLEELKANLESLQLENKELRTKATSIHESSLNADKKNDQLEKMIEKLKTKLRETRDQLKQCQADLQRAQTSRPSSSEETTKISARSQAFRKRKAHDMVADDFTHIEIPTPGADDTTKGRRSFKKRVFEPTVVGEKSMFSITPFLNRTKSIIEDTPQADEEAPDDSILAARATEAEVVEPVAAEPAVTTAEDNASETTPPAPTETEKPKPGPKTRGRPKKVLGDAPSAKKNAQPVPKKALKTKSSLEKVVEEESTEGNQENQPGAQAPAEKTMTVKFNFDLPQDESTASSTNGGDQQKKKKRKILGSTKTLFDEEEGEAQPARKPAKVQLGAKRTLGKAPLGGKRNAFAGAASFSPLKRDRRGVGASFLA